MPSETRRIGLPPARASLPSSFRTVGKTPSTNVQNWRIVSLLLFIWKKLRTTQLATMSKSKCFEGLVGGGREKEMNNCWECEITWNRALIPIRSSHIVAQPPSLFYYLPVSYVSHWRFLSPYEYLYGHFGPFDGQSHKVILCDYIETGDRFIFGLNRHEFACFILVVFLSSWKSGIRQKEIWHGEMPLFLWVVSHRKIRKCPLFSLSLFLSFFPRKMAWMTYRPLPGLNSRPPSLHTTPRLLDVCVWGETCRPWEERETKEGGDIGRLAISCVCVYVRFS